MLISTTCLQMTSLSGAFLMYDVNTSALNAADSIIGIILVPASSLWLPFTIGSTSAKLDSISGATSVPRRLLARLRLLQQILGTQLYPELQIVRLPTATLDTSLAIYPRFGLFWGHLPRGTGSQNTTFVCIFQKVERRICTIWALLTGKI